MPIPMPNDAGWLDPNPDPYSATLDEVEDVFVVQAPNPEPRSRVMDALSLYLGLIYELGDPAPTWLSGGFISHDPNARPDVELVYLCRDTDHLRTMLQRQGIYQLLTLQTVFAELPMLVNIPELRPVGGLVDAHLASPRRQTYWASRLSIVTKPDGRVAPGVRKGFVEVTL